MPRNFDYDTAFSRNIGWVTGWEQQVLRAKRVAVAGMGGVGGIHLLTLARLGIGAFTIADFDRFDTVNFNRQAGAVVSSLDRPKVDVMAEMAADINPDLDIRMFPDGINAANIDRFLADVDLFVDGLDFFAVEARALAFQKCADLGIPAITAAPIGMGTSYLIFMPGHMTFEAFFRLNGLPLEKQYVNLGLGLTPRSFHSSYLMDRYQMDLTNLRAPSTVIGCNLSAAVVGTEAVKILLKRGDIRPAPWVHQFDIYRARWSQRYLRGGNRNPVQRLRLAIGYRMFAKIAAQSVPESGLDAEGSSTVGKILNHARWAPSGDNGQPWRFRILDQNRVEILLRTEPGNVYEYGDGAPSLVALGCLLENIKIAASKFNHDCNWTYLGKPAEGHQILVEMKPGKTVPDPLFDYIKHRSVDRTRYRRNALEAGQKCALEAALGAGLRVTWFENARARRAFARLNATASHIRLSIPESYDVHRKILDWDHSFSPDRVPVKSLGLDPGSRALMKFFMVSWRRMRFANRFVGARLVPKWLMELRPGRACAAHFIVTNATVHRATDGGNGVEDLIRVGQGVQRLWLTATQLGLVLQPSFAPLCFAHYAKTGALFTTERAMVRRAARLSEALERVTATKAEEILFMGRIGVPRSRHAQPRSVRLPLENLMIPRSVQSQEGADIAT